MARLGHLVGRIPARVVPHEGKSGEIIVVPQIIAKESVPSLQFVRLHPGAVIVVVFEGERGYARASEKGVGHQASVVVVRSDGNRGDAFGEFTVEPEARRARSAEIPKFGESRGLSRIRVLRRVPELES